MGDRKVVTTSSCSSIEPAVASVRVETDDATEQHRELIFKDKKIFSRKSWTEN